ncbi:MAG: hypothetical protein HGA53_00985, partial [Anaerolineaceae bacterium]|nr:hypothetical protein [Anaerolineaceae bacterium]
MFKNIFDRVRETYQRLSSSLFGRFQPEARFILVPAGIVFSLLILALIFSRFSPGAQNSEKSTATEIFATSTEYPYENTSTPEIVYEPETPTRTSSLRGTKTSTTSPTFFVRVNPTKTNTPVRTITRTRTQTLSITRTITRTTTVTSTLTATITSTPTLERLVFSGDASTNLQGTPSPDGIIDIASMDIAGGTKRMIYAGSNLSGNLTAWDSSPDGTWLVIETGPTAQRSLYLLQIDGLALKELPNLPSSKNSQAAWSPDGQWIVFRSGEVNNGDLYAIRPGGDDLRQLTNGTEDEHMPDFSPDGTRLIYA